MAAPTAAALARVDDPRETLERTMLNEKRDVAAEYMAAMAGYRPAPPAQAAEPSSAETPPAGGQPVFAPWGAVTDPHEAINVFMADPQTREALLDANHPLHASAVRRRTELYAAAYGDTPVPPAGSGWGRMSPTMHEEFAPPTEAEMRAAHVRTATDIIQRAELYDPETGGTISAETAQALAQIAVASGFSSVDISDLAIGIRSTRAPNSPEQVREMLGQEVIERAQAVASAMRLPQELLDLPVTENLVLGEHPVFIKLLARKAI